MFKDNHILIDKKLFEFYMCIKSYDIIMNNQTNLKRKEVIPHT